MESVEGVMEAEWTRLWGRGEECDIEGMRTGGRELQAKTSARVDPRKCGRVVPVGHTWAGVGYRQGRACV